MLELADFENARRCLRVKEKKVYDDQKVDDQIEGKLTFDVEEKLHDKKFAQNLSNILLELEGIDFDLKYIQEHGFNTPILFKSKKGLGMKLPDPKLFSVIDVKSYVGARRIIDCFDCSTHQQLQMSVHHWVRYYTGTEREKILNVTSLEFSHTGLARIVDCPSVVRDNLDWIMNVWPQHLINEQKDTTNLVENMKYPKVRKYVLMSVAGCYTDFHIDFGGTSVWYHILKGSKVFWLVPPSVKNLEIYEGWVLSGRQEDVFFGDMVDNCYRIHLVAGDTFMIPTGWIHGVYTCDDSLVFGGNFLHSFNIPMQLKAYDIEENTHVPKKLRFPFFAEIHWYMIKTYVDVLERDMDERRRLEFEADDVDAFKLVKYEMNKEVDEKEEKPKSNWQCVYLTVYELEGLKLICERFRRWPYAKLNYPKDLKEDSMELLDRLEELLQHHEDDDQILACRGINIFKQLKVERPDDVKLPPISPLNTPLNKQYFPATYTPPPEPEKPKEPKKLVEKKVILKNTPVVFENKVSRKKEKEKEKEVQPTAKKKNVIRRVRCNACEQCNKENCNKCRYCLDMIKNGGEGRLRKSCQIRFCLDPQLPNYVECKICHKGKSDTSVALVECSICGEIVHRSCLKTKKPCKMSKNVKFCWECPNCYENKNPQNTTTKVEKVKTPKVTNGHVKVNANVKVQNLKNLIQMNKIKINKQDSKESQPSLKRKRKRSSSMS